MGRPPYAHTVLMKVRSKTISGKPGTPKKEYTERQKEIMKEMKGVKMSYYEIRVFNVLKELGIKSYFNYRIKDVLVKGRRKLLFYDFYLPELNAEIEYDGPDHFFDADLERLNERKKNDFVKNVYSIKKKIKLLRVKYTEKDNLEDLVRSFILKVNK